MSRLPRTLALWLTLVLAAPSLAPSSSRARAAEAPVVRKIVFQGLQGLAEETIRFYLQLEGAEGKPLDAARLDERIHYLWGRNLIDDIRAETVPVDGGVELRITVKERPVLRSLTYDGLKKVQRSDIDDKVDKERIQVREGLPLDLGELRRLETAIRDVYREKGYRFADVRSNLETTAPGEVRLTFTVDEGDRVRIADIDFEGNTVFGDRRLRWTMKKTKETGIISRVSKHDVYNPATLAEDLDKVRDLYRQQGYKNVFIGEPEVEVRALEPDAPTSKGKKRRLFLTIPVEEGERWKFGEVTVEGASVYRPDLLLKFFRKPRGGWLRSKTIDEGVDAIRDLYKNNGYILAQVNSELRERSSNVADVVVHVQENDQFRVGRLEFKGNSRTRDKVLRREMRVQEGTVMNMGALQDSLYKIKQLNYFELNEDDPILFDPDYEKKVVNLVVQGKEADRTELQIGGGWSEVDGFFGQFSMQTRNFMGRGETVGISYQSGKYRDMFDLSYFVPWFLDRPQSIGVSLFRRNLDYSLLSSQQYTERSSGGSISYGRSFGLFNSFSVGYTNQNVDTQESLLNSTGGTTVVKYQRQISSIRPNYAYDSRNNRIQPTQGMRLSLSADLAGSFLGGSSDYAKPEVGFSYFRPLSGYPLRTVGAVNIEAGYLHSLDDYVFLPTELYFLGGDNSIRGFRFRQIWARCVGGELIPKPGSTTGETIPCAPDATYYDRNGLIQGGNKYFQANLEYQFLFGEPFRLVFFADLGNVYASDQSYDLSRLRYSAGAEFRVFVPVLGAPLRFIYSKNLDPLPDDAFESFDFSIGATF